MQEIWRVHLWGGYTPIFPRKHTTLCLRPTDYWCQERQGASHYFTLTSTESSAEREDEKNTSFASSCLPSQCGSPAQLPLHLHFLPQKKVIDHLRLVHLKVSSQASSFNLRGYNLQVQWDCKPVTGGWLPSRPACRLPWYVGYGEKEDCWTKQAYDWIEQVLLLSFLAMIATEPPYVKGSMNALEWHPQQEWILAFTFCQAIASMLDLSRATRNK